MKLKDWMKNERYSQLKVAELTGINAMRVHRICTGYAPTLQEVSIIYDFTKRKVTWKDFLDEAKDESRK